MTVIAAYWDKDVPPVIGCDQLITCEEVKFLCDTKLYRHEGWVLGQRGDVRAGTIIESEIASLIGGLPSGQAGVLAMANKLERAFREHGFEWEPHPGEGGAPEFGMGILVASKQGLWEIDSSLGVSFFGPGRVWAVGSGFRYALGAAHGIMRKRNWRDTTPAHDLVKAMVEAAIDNDPFCGGKALVETV